MDYAPLEATYSIIDMDRNSAAVDLIDDDVLEGEEMFTASLFPVGLLPSNIVFDPIEASALIIDNDGNYSCVCIIEKCLLYIESERTYP